MKKIRLGVFETNSSSTHSMVICSKEEFEKWRKGELLYVRDWWSLKDKDVDHPDTNFITPKEYEDLMDKGFDEGDAMDYGRWGREYEVDVNRYTTKGEEEIVIACYYGYDN